MAYIHGSGQPSTVTDQAVRAMPPAVRKQFRAELQLLAADATLDVLGQLGVTPSEIRKAVKTGSLKKALRKERRPVAKRKKAKKSRAPKSARPAIGKAYSGNVVPISAAKSARTCWNGHAPGNAGARCCVWCGEEYGISYSEHTTREVAKAMKAASAPKSRQQFLDECHNDYNPHTREMTWAAMTEQYGLGDGGQTA